MDNNNNSNNEVVTNPINISKLDLEFSSDKNIDAGISVDIRL